MDIYRALRLLNWEQVSNISPNMQFWIDRFDEPGLDEQEQLEIVRSLRDMTGQLADPYELAEVLCHCGVFFYRLQKFESGRKCLRQAAEQYYVFPDLHRSAMAYWMSYLASRSAGYYRRAFDEGRRARMYLQEKAREYAQLERIAGERWYQDRVQDMTTILVSSPPDVYEWLFEFRGSRLSLPAGQVKDRLQENIERRAFIEADQDKELLLEMTARSGDCEETAEAMAYSGIVDWVMERQSSAIFYFRSALTQYLPATHEYALLTWLVGLAQFYFPKQRARAITSMESAIQQFDRLRQQAIHEHQEIRRDWYALHQVAMRQVLTRRIAGRF